MTKDHVLLSDMPGLGSVSVCPCGTIHIAVGPMTLRLAPEAFHQMMTMCSDAVTELSHDQTLVQQAAASPFMH